MAAATSSTATKSAKATGVQRMSTMKSASAQNIHGDNNGVANGSNHPLSLPNEPLSDHQHRRNQSDVDINVFLSTLETKLRNPFSSLDLVKTIDSSQDPLDYLRQINDAVFDPAYSSKARIDKPYKLRILIGLLGLEKSQRLNNEHYEQFMNEREGGHEVEDTADIIDSTDVGMTLGAEDADVIWSLLRNAQLDDEEWVRTIAGIVRGKMYTQSQLPKDRLEHGTLENGHDDKATKDKGESCTSSRGDEADKIIEKTNKKVIKETFKSISIAKEKERDELSSDKMSTSGLVANDTIPFYAPKMYHLLNPPILLKILPELYDSNTHFTPNLNAEILQYDAVQEKARANEEEKELEQQQMLKEKKRAMQMKSNCGSAGRAPAAAEKTSSVAGAKRPGGDPRGDGTRLLSAHAVEAADRMSGIKRKPSGAVPTVKAGEFQSGGIQSKSPMTSSMLRTGLGRGRQLPTGGAGMMTAPRSNLMKQRLAGRSNVASNRTQLSATRKVTGVAGRAGALVSGSRGLASSGGGTGGATRARQQQGSKMKLIDMDEVKDKEKQRHDGVTADALDDSRAKRKRKLIEQAAACGLKSNTKWSGAESTHPDQGDESLETAAKQIADNESKARSVDEKHSIVSRIDSKPTQLEKSSVAGAVDTMHANGLLSDQQTSAAHLAPRQSKVLAAHDASTCLSGTTDTNATNAYTGIVQLTDAGQPDFPRPLSTHENWKQLLEQSNKLNQADRDRIVQFFTAHRNPTPDQMSYRIKMHEEKIPQSDGISKQTVYLELDYNTFGFKKLRKIKKIKTE